MTISAKALGLKLKNGMSNVSLLDERRRTNILFCHIISNCGHECGKYHPALDVCPPCDFNSTNRCFGDCKKHITVKCFGKKRNLEDFQCSVKCHKQLDCSHLCSQLCHKGSCPDRSMCQEKVIVRCECKHVNDELNCHEAQTVLKDNSKYKSSKKSFKQFILPCTSECSKSRSSPIAVKEGAIDDKSDVLKKKKTPNVTKLKKHKKIKSKGINRADAVRAASQAIKEHNGSQFMSLERYIFRVVMIFLSVIIFMLLVDEFITKPAYEMENYRYEADDEGYYYDDEDYYY